jgi:UDP-N-acetylmuramoyl-tripeptide--D-alanyl-D-alanine ligase
VAIGNADDPRVVAGLEGARAQERVTYGSAEEATYRIRERRLVAPDAQRLVLATPHGKLTLWSPLLGVAGALACAGALAGVEALFGAELDAAAVNEGLSAAGELLSDRMSPRRLPSGVWLIDDSYNANPASCRASIATAKELSELLGRRLVLVLGEMRELGDVSEQAHQELGELAGASAALVICVGGDAVHTHRAAESRTRSVFVADSKAAAERALAEVSCDDVVLVKGSRGVRTENVVRALTGGAA